MATVKPHRAVKACVTHANPAILANHATAANAVVVLANTTNR
jgi:hypothetical protein